MSAFYSKERSKYGNLTGQVIIWPVSYEGDPNTASNKNSLPAGYLKCDGTKYFAKDYPTLASILGTGSNCKYLRRNPDGTAFDILTDDQFMVPDLGSKYPEPTSGANAGSYNNIRVENSNGNLTSRSGIGIEATSSIGDTVTITYSGTITVPSQEIPLEVDHLGSMQEILTTLILKFVEESMVAAHMHFSSSTRARNMQINESSVDEPNAFGGRTGRRNASTIPIQDWLDATRHENDSSTPPGSGQNPCKAIDGYETTSGTPVDQTSFITATIYYGMCIYGAGNAYVYNCLSNEEYDLDRDKTEGSPDGSTTGEFANLVEDPLFWNMSLEWTGCRCTLISNSSYYI